MGRLAGEGLQELAGKLGRKNADWELGRAALRASIGPLDFSNAIFYRGIYRNPLPVALSRKKLLRGQLPAKVAAL